MPRFFGICALLIAGALPLISQEAEPKQEAPKTETTEPQSTKPASSKPGDIREQAWNLLREGIKDEKLEHRATAVRVLALLPGEPEAIQLACEAMTDPKPEVRAAAVEAIARRNRFSMVNKIVPAMSDSSDPVKYTAAAAILHMHDVSKARSRKKK